MYLNNQNIKLPEDPDTIVWKYLICLNFGFVNVSETFHALR
jgi:hypothetical protein